MSEFTLSGGTISGSTLALLPVAFVGGWIIARWLIREAKEILGIQSSVIILECPKCAKVSTVNRYGDIDEAIRWSMAFAQTHCRCNQKGEQS